MQIKRTKQLTKKQKKNILALWNEEYPEVLSLSDISAFDGYLEGLSDKHHLLVINGKEDESGWLIDFIRDDERCFAMLLHASLQGKGYGTKLLNIAKQTNAELNGWVIDNNEQKNKTGKTINPLPAFIKRTILKSCRAFSQKKWDSWDKSKMEKAETS